MSTNKQYYTYLKGRSQLGLCYRRYWLYPRLNRHIHGKALDVGCGIGDFLRYRPGTVGVDINSDTVQWCQQQGLDARLMPIDHLPFNDAHFDSVMLDNVLEHLAQPEPLLQQIHRVLRPSGTLLVGVPGQRGYASDPDHKIFYDAALLVSTTQHAGFHLTQLFYTPVQSEWLNEHMRQYCLYGVFQKTPHEKSVSDSPMPHHD
ncbi:MAG: class I SAM-dependent methyltransferase [Limnobacter sp.]|nr:class I SAM-dependent methyltransferase [Limnobacter sp.]